MAKEIYEAYALKFAWRDVRRSSNFLGGDPQDASMPMDYMFWLVRNESKTILLDVGFTAEVSAKRGRTYLRTPRDALAMMGVSPKDVTEAIISHFHYDHVGTLNDFPNARFHIQDAEMTYATGRYMASRQFNHSFEIDDVITLVRLVYENRVSVMTSSI
jgi:glyoxylase-like metal-dependent hydrolase (beta-lactamase superfamily II)